MTAFSLRPAMLAFAPLALALQGCATYSEPVAEPAAPVVQPAAPAEPVGPGLWKVGIETTIYLFGTIRTAKRLNGIADRSAKRWRKRRN